MCFRQAWFFTRQVGRGGSSQSHERERGRVRHFRPRRDGDGARVGVAQDREVAVAEEDLSRRRRRRRDARGPPAERARLRGRARRRRPLEIPEPRRRRLGVAGDDAVRRVDDARARRGPPAAAEGRVGQRRVEVAVVAPPAFFCYLWSSRVYFARESATPGREKTFFTRRKFTRTPSVQAARGAGFAARRRPVVVSGRQTPNFARCLRHALSGKAGRAGLWSRAVPKRFVGPVLL